MSKVRCWWGALAAAAALAGASAHAAQPASRLDTLAQAERSVVRVVAVSLDQNNQILNVGFGSGFAVAPGRVVTNEHVVEGAQGAWSVRIFVIAERDIGGRPAPATVIRNWAQADLALLAAPQLTAPAIKLSAATPDKQAIIHALG